MQLQLFAGARLIHLIEPTVGDNVQEVKHVLPAVSLPRQDRHRRGWNLTVAPKLILKRRSMACERRQLYTSLHHTKLVST